MLELVDDVDNDGDEFIEREDEKETKRHPARHQQLKVPSSYLERPPHSSCLRVLSEVFTDAVKSCLVAAGVKISGHKRCAELGEDMLESTRARREKAAQIGAKATKKAQALADRVAAAKAKKAQALVNKEDRAAAAEAKRAQALAGRAAVAEAKRTQALICKANRAAAAEAKRAQALADRATAAEAKKAQALINKASKAAVAEAQEGQTGNGKTGKVNRNQAGTQAKQSGASNADARPTKKVKTANGAGHNAQAMKKGSKRKPTAQPANEYAKAFNVSNRSRRAR